MNVPLRLLRYSAQRRSLAFVAGPVHAVDEQDVLPAVGVVVENAQPGRAFRAAACRRRRRCCGGTADPGGAGDVDERKPGARRGWPRAADRPRVAPTQGLRRHRDRAHRAGTRAGSQQVDQAVLKRVDDELGGLVHAERVHDVGAVHGDRVDAQVELRRRSRGSTSPSQISCSTSSSRGVSAGCARPSAACRLDSAGIEHRLARRDRLTAAARSRSSAFFSM